MTLRSTFLEWPAFAACSGGNFPSAFGSVMPFNSLKTLRLSLLIAFSQGLEDGTECFFHQLPPSYWMPLSPCPQQQRRQALSSISAQRSYTSTQASPLLPTTAREQTGINSNNKHGEEGKGTRHLECISHSYFVSLQIKIALCVPALLDCLYRPSHGSTSLAWEADWLLNWTVEAVQSAVCKWPDLGQSQPLQGHLLFLHNPECGKYFSFWSLHFCFWRRGGGLSPSCTDTEWYSELLKAVLIC